MSRHDVFERHRRRVKRMLDRMPPAIRGVFELENSRAPALYRTSEYPDGEPFTFAEFEAANQDAPLDAADMASVAALAPGESAELGGGACGVTTITRVS